jgi:ATP-dependent DNA helicase DinG
MSTLHNAIDAFFAANGPLAKLLSGYQPRTPQIDMAHAVVDALTTKSARAAIEAGTGTGKSMAYLAASLLADKRVVITTGTKALQDQLYTKDVPLALRAVAELKGERDDVERDPAVLVKGRANYLCKLRFERFAQQPTFAFSSEAKEFVQITRWQQSTTTGDKAELLTLPDPYSAWSDIDAGSETCIGQRCMFYEQCFVVKMKRRAEGARLVVANHHLLCADLRLRLETRGADNMGDVGGMGAHVLPDADAYILDEAHALPDIASDYFGVSVGSGALARMFGDVRKQADTFGGDDRAAVLDAMIAAEEHCDRLLSSLTSSNERARDRERLRLPANGASAVSAASDALASLHRVLDKIPDEVLAGVVDGATKKAERMRLLERVSGAKVEIDFVLKRAIDDSGFVVVAEPTKKGAVITATPVDVASALGMTLFSLEQPVVMTSATLAVAGDVAPFLARVGAKAESTKSAVLPSPFDFAKRGALYCPKDMPEPEHASYAARFVDEAKFLLATTKGGALFLFTSNRALDEGHAALAPIARAMGISVFRQGEMQKQKLLDEMRAHTGEVGALLCATRSFWEGVDVRGRALRLVVVDRLPFDVPTDPVRKARADLCRAKGGDPFRDISLPDAALTLRQGAGRLLRDVDDAGVVAVLDGRLRKKSYGRVFLETLPPLTKIGSRSALLEFWDRFVRPSLGLSGGSA